MRGLIVDTRDSRRRAFDWKAGTIRFGSGVDCDLVLGAPGIAEHHGAFETTGDGCRVVVLAEATPIELNGASTRGAALRAGDVLRVGPFQLSFSEATAKAAAAAPSRPPAAAARPAAAAAASSSSRRSSTAAAPELTDAELRRERLASKVRAKNAGKGGPNPEGMKAVAIITGLIALAVLAFMFGGGNAWSGLAAGNYKSHLEVARIKMQKCEFDDALKRCDDVLKEDDRNEVAIAVEKVRTEINNSKKEYAALELEFVTLQQQAESKSLDAFQRLAAIYMNNTHRRFGPLFDKADALLKLVNSGKFTPTGIKIERPPEAVEANPEDFESKGAAPGFGGRKTGTGEN